MAVEWYRNRLRTRSRYHEAQFTIYNELWISLNDLRLAGDCLWESADSSNLRRFARQLEKTRVMISKNVLLIEEEHLKELNKIIGEFGNYHFGKKRLIELRNRHGDREVDGRKIEEMIRNNQQIKEQYDHLLSDVAQSLKKQLKS